MHFAPQWVKPIKPSASAASSDANPSAHKAGGVASGAPSSPFPALGAPRSGSPNTSTAHPPLSYSRVTHTPASPSFSGDGYFPYSDGQNGDGGPGAGPFPFRYSREQILGIWDEDKFKERPIELMQMAETERGPIIVSKSIVKPVGLRELSELEKRLLSTSVHPPMSNRRQQGHNDQSAPNARRAPAASGIKDSGGGTAQPQQPRAGHGGFGRGEGGAFGGSKFSGALEGRQPGSLGGGFGGVGKRAPRRDEDPMRPSAASTWRPTRTASGTFEGVLGFNSTTPSQPESERDEKGWGAAQKQWRNTPDERTDEASASIIATASATPVAERDAMIRGGTPSSMRTNGVSTPLAQEREDLGAINWFYRDPNGQEQGPFTGSQMHDWYSHSYFQDELPVRRESESGFHTLSELKTSTGNAVQPFLSPVRPRLPPNLPIPLAALQAGAVGSIPSPSHSMNESFRHLSMAPQPQFQQYPAPFGQPAFGAPGAPFGQQWSPAPGPSHSPARQDSLYGSIGGQSYSPYGGIGTPVHARPDPFAALGNSTWAAPSVPQNITAWQNQQHQSQHHHHQPMQAPIAQQPIAQPTSHTLESAVAPEADHYDEESDEEEVNDEPAAMPEPQREPTPELEDEDEDETFVVPAPEDEPESDEEDEPIAEPEPVKPPVSVWGKVPSRKSSIATPLPAPPASLPAKPEAAPAPAPAAAPPSPPAPAPATPTEKPAPKPAPWADKPKPVAAGPSLREIQEIEARQAEARKQAREAARAAAAPVSIRSSTEDLPSSMAWGLPTSTSGKSTSAAATPTSHTPPAPAWGGASDGPKKTLTQIQEEEEKRNVKAAARSASAAASVASAVPKRGYADLAAHAPAPTPVAGWTTVGAGGKSGAKPAAAPVVAKPTPVIAPKPVIVAKPAPTKANGGPADDSPSLDFVRWTKNALVGLNVPVDEFISMLLQFPADPPAASRGEVQEIIADSVYASSATLDGRRFASEFMARRKADVAAKSTGVKSSGGVSIADVVRSKPTPPAAEAGFKVVKAKKKRN